MKIMISVRNGYWFNLTNDTGHALGKSKKYKSKHSCVKALLATLRNIERVKYLDGLSWFIPSRNGSMVFETATFDSTEVAKQRYEELRVYAQDESPKVYQYKGDYHTL